MKLEDKTDQHFYLRIIVKKYQSTVVKLTER